MSLPFTNLRRIQVCKTRDSFRKLVFSANLPRRHDIPWHCARTDIGCPRSRAKKCPHSRAGKCRVASSWSLALLLLPNPLTDLLEEMVEFVVADAGNRRRLCERRTDFIEGARLGNLLLDCLNDKGVHVLPAARSVLANLR